jgi:hypothetical protein
LAIVGAGTAVARALMPPCWILNPSFNNSERSSVDHPDALTLDCLSPQRIFAYCVSMDSSD